MIFERVRHLRGQLIAYAGGTGLSAYSKAVSAVPVLHDISITRLTPEQIFGLGGLMVLVLRFAFDVYVYFDRRKRERRRSREE